MSLIAWVCQGDGQGHLSWSRLWLEASSQPLQPSLTAAGGRGRPFCRRTPNPKIWEARGGTVHIKGRRFEGSTHVRTRALCEGFLGCHQSLGEAVVAQAVPGTGDPQISNFHQSNMLHPLKGG